MSGGIAPNAECERKETRRVWAVSQHRSSKSEFGVPRKCRAEGTILRLCPVARQTIVCFLAPRNRDDADGQSAVGWTCLGMSYPTPEQLAPRRTLDT
jgi:hypothetical protein